MTTLNSNGRTLTAVRPDIFQIFLQDEDGQNILGIDDGALRQSLRVEIVNTSGKDIELQPIAKNDTNSNNYNFAVLFRPGTLLDVSSITFQKPSEDWTVKSQGSNFYFGISQQKTIIHGERITFTLESIGAAPGGGARGTRVEIKYDRLKYQGSNGPISGNKLQYLNIVNQRGKKQIPLYVGFLGSNTILNDGTENELTLTIQSLLNQNNSFTFLKSSEVTINPPEGNTNTTRWKGNFIKFIQEKISKIDKLRENITSNTQISKSSKDFFQALFEEYNNKLKSPQIPSTEAPSTESLSSNFQKLKDALKNSVSSLKDEDKKEIASVLINNLDIISQDDLNAIVPKIGELLSLESQIIQELVQDIINNSQDIKVIQSVKPGKLNFQGFDLESTLDESTKFTISFDVTEDSNDSSKSWALVDENNADNINIEEITNAQELKNWTVVREKNGITPQWSFACKKGLQLEDRQEILRLNISNLKTQLLSGYANLYVHYENIPGYWDGYITVPIHKGPLVYREKIFYDLNLISLESTDQLPKEGKSLMIVAKIANFYHVRIFDGTGNKIIDKGKDEFLSDENDENLIQQLNALLSAPQSIDEQIKSELIKKITSSLGLDLGVACVGIGTDEPKAKLHIKSSAGVDGLKVEGNTAIAGDLSITNGNPSDNFESNQITLALNNTDKYRHAIKSRHSSNGRAGNAIDFYVWKCISDDDKDKPDTVGTLHTMTLDGGNVGIGTTDPGDNKLKVEGNTSIAGDLSITNGKVGIGIKSSGAKLDIAGKSNDTAQTSLQVRSGNTSQNFKSNQITLAFDNTDQYRHAIKSRHSSNGRAGNAIDFYVWKCISDDDKDKPDTVGTLHTMTLDGGNVGIGTTDPGDNKLKVEGKTAIAGDLSITNGKVGIGTTDPGDNKLKVEGKTAIAGDLSVEGNTAIAGNLSVTDGVVISDVFRSSTNDWEIARNGENLEIREPEQQNKVWARFTDDQSLHLIGTPNLLVDGNVGIGTNNPRSKLEVNGGIRLSDVPVWNENDDNDLTWDGSRITREGSSRRYKQNISLLEDDFSKILSLEPKQYEMKEECGGGQGKLNFGYIAEELDELGLSNLVTYDESGQPDGIKYKKMCIYLLEVIKELNKKVDVFCNSNRSKSRSE